jgi:hypothetical protein
MAMRMGAPIFRFTRVAPPWPKCTQSSGPAVVRLVRAWPGAWLTVTYGPERSCRRQIRR